MELLVQRCRVDSFRFSSSAARLGLLDKQLPRMGAQSYLLGYFNCNQHHNCRRVWRSKIWLSTIRPNLE